ncbi:MAG: PQQ-binding-like beta-propeller repeat protein [Candidatus Thorarchaeota archaeon]
MEKQEIQRSRVIAILLVILFASQSLIVTQQTLSIEESTHLTPNRYEVRAQAQWVYETNSPIRSSPAFSDFNTDSVQDILVCDYSGTIHAIDGSDGLILWTAVLPGSIRSSPGISKLNEDDIPDILIGSEDFNLYALNGYNGEILWSYETNGPIVSSPLVCDLNDDGRLEVLFGSYDNNFYVVSADDATLLWSSPTTDWIKSSPAVCDIDGDDTLEVVVGCYDSKVYAWNGEDGSIAWTYTTNGPIESSPAIGDLDGDNMVEVIVGSLDDKVYALNGEDGTLLWAFTTSRWVKSSPALGDIDGDRQLEVIIGSCDGGLYALNGEDGSLLWVFETSDWVRSSPGLADLDDNGGLDIVFGSYDGYVYGLDGFDGSQIWKLDLHGSIDSSPVLTDFQNDGVMDLVVGTLNSEVHYIQLHDSGVRVYWQAFSGDALFERLRSTLSFDSDSDMLSMYSEEILGTNSTNPDSDLDTMQDGWEIHYQLDPFVDDTDIDLDMDGLSNLQEYLSKTNPRISDDTSPPEVLVSHYPLFPFENQPVTVTASILDEAGINLVVLSYSLNGGIDWTNLTMIEYGIEWNASIQPQLPGIVTYRVYARDFSGNWRVTDVFSYHVRDTVLRIIETNHSPIEPNETDIVEVITSLNESSDVLQAILSYSTDVMTSWTNTTMLNSDKNWTGVIPSQPRGTAVYYMIHVQDVAFNWGTSSIASYTVGDINPPIIKLERSPRVPSHLESVNVTANITDSNAVVLVILSHSIDSGSTWINSTMDYVGSQWNGTIPGYPTGVIVQYLIYAEDSISNQGNSSIVSYEVSDSINPSITLIQIQNTQSYINDIQISALVEDNSTINQVILSYSTNDGFSWLNVTMTKSGTEYSEIIPSQPLGTNVRYMVYAEDGVGNWGVSEEDSYDVIDDIEPLVTIVRLCSSTGELVPIVVNATINDVSGVIQTVLSYSINNGTTWINVTMVDGIEVWTGTIPEQPLGTLVRYKVYAEDGVGNWGMSEEDSYTVIDDSSPLIYLAEPNYIHQQASLLINATINDVSGVIQAVLSYSANNGITWTNVTMVDVTDVWTGTIVGQPLGTAVRYKVYAEDGIGNWGVSNTSLYLIPIFTTTEPSPPDDLSSNQMIGILGAFFGFAAIIILTYYDKDR